MLDIDVEAIYRRHAPMVSRRCRALLKDEQAAEDAVHETFVLVMRHRGRLDLQRPTSLLFRIATNVCLNMLRAQRRRPHGAADMLEQIAAASTPWTEVAKKLWWESLLGEVAPTIRLVAVLHLVDGMTLDEVAAETGLSVGGVRKRLDKLKLAAHAVEGAGA